MEADKLRVEGECEGGWSSVALSRGGKTNNIVTVIDSVRCQLPSFCTSPVGFPTIHIMTYVNMNVNQGVYI